MSKSYAPHRGLIMLLMLVAMAPPLAPAAEHQFGPYAIHVAADTDTTLGEGGYQITVENEELLLSRLTAGAGGALSNTFVADLDGNGTFEVVVTFASVEGAKNAVHVYTWNNNRLEPHKVATLDAAQSSGYRGNDEFAVNEGRLVRIFQIYENVEGRWEPTAEQRRLRYSLAEQRWLPE